LSFQKKDTQSIWIDIAVFTAVLAFFFYSMKIITKIPAEKSRAPASIRETDPAPARNTASVGVDQRRDSIKTLNLGCLPAQKPRAPLEVNAAMLKIVGELCLGANYSVRVKRDQSNDEEILTFLNPKMRSLTTNYFPLQNGPNKIVFEITFGKKKTIETIEIVRSSGSS